MQMELGKSSVHVYFHSENLLVWTQIYIYGESEQITHIVLLIWHEWDIVFFVSYWNLLELGNISLHIQYIKYNKEELLG